MNLTRERRMTQSDWEKATRPSAAAIADMLDNLPSNIESERTWRRLSWRALGDEVGIPWQTIYGYVNHRKAASTPVLVALLRWLDGSLNAVRPTSLAGKGEVE